MPPKIQNSAAAQRPAAAYVVEIHPSSLRATLQSASEEWKHLKYEDAEAFKVKTYPLGFLKSQNLKAGHAFLPAIEWVSGGHSCPPEPIRIRADCRSPPRLKKILGLGAIWARR